MSPKDPLSFIKTSLTIYCLISGAQIHSFLKANKSPLTLYYHFENVRKTPLRVPNEYHVSKY